MNTRRDGGSGVKELPFLSAHRCPGVDLLPNRVSATRIPSLCERVQNVTCTASPEDKDVHSSCHSDEEEEEEGNVSDWSEEDLSLHLSPSVILPSDEESDAGSDFECVDVIVDPQVESQGGAGLRRVPKRQILLKRRDTEDNMEADKPEQVTSGAGGAKSAVSANQVCCPPLRDRPELLLRQHSMPTSFNKHPTTEVDGNNQVYRGLKAGAHQGFQAVQTDDCAPRRLQKSFSLDETKTKLATCIIRSVLTKKMQGEQSAITSSEYHSYSNTKCSRPQGAAQTTQKNHQPAAHLNPSPSRQLESGRKLEKEAAREGEVGGGFGVFNPCVHMVRDVRHLVKNTNSLSFRSNPTSAATQPVVGHNSGTKLSMFKVIGQEGSPPPSYQQAVGVKCHNEGSQLCPQPLLYNITSRRNKVNAGTALHQSQHREDCDRFNHPIIEQRRSNEPIVSKTKMAPSDTWSDISLDTPTTEPNQSERGEGSTSEPPSVSTPSHTPPPRAQSSTLVPPSAPRSTHTHFTSTFPSTLTGYPASLNPHLGKLSYVHGPLSYIQTQLPQPGTVHLQRLSEAEDNHDSLTCPTSYQPDGDKGLIKSCGPHRDGTGQTQWNSNTTTQQQQQQQQHKQQQEQQQEQQKQLQQQLQQQQQQLQFLWNVQGFLPTAAGSPFLTFAVAPGNLYNGHTPQHVMLDAESGRSLCVDLPFQPQRKMLLDPETGRYFDVLLPAAAMMSYHPVPTLYGPPCLPFSLLTQPVNLTHTMP